MKILLINNFHYIKGGSDAVYFNMARMLTSMGHQVVFFSCKSCHNLDYGRNDHFVEANSDINPIVGAIRYIYNGAAKRALERLLKEHKPDIAHIHLFWGGLSSSILGVLKRHNIPVVHTVHDYRLICPAYLLRRTDGTICHSCNRANALSCIKYRCANGSLIRSGLMATEFHLRNRFIRPLRVIDGFIFVSHFNYNEHLKALPELAEKHILVAHNAIEMPSKEVISSNIGDYYLYFGRLSSEKGLTTLIKAFNTLPHLRLKIVGEGALRETLQNIAGPNIEFCGYQSGEALRQTILHCKANIVASECYENNPMSVIESCALGIPTIGAHIGGIPEIILEGKTGYTFTSKSTTELRQAVLSFENLSAEEYNTISRACREFACNNFSEDKLYYKIINFYTSILDSYDS